MPLQANIVKNYESEKPIDVEWMSWSPLRNSGSPYRPDQNPDLGCLLPEDPWGCKPSFAGGVASSSTTGATGVHLPEEHVGSGPGIGVSANVPPRPKVRATPLTPQGRQTPEVPGPHGPPGNPRPRSRSPRRHRVPPSPTPQHLIPSAPIGNPGVVTPFYPNGQPMTPLPRTPRSMGPPTTPRFRVPPSPTPQHMIPAAPMSNPGVVTPFYPNGQPMTPVGSVEDILGEILAFTSTTSTTMFTAGVSTATMLMQLLPSSGVGVNVAGMTSATLSSTTSTTPGATDEIEPEEEIPDYVDVPVDEVDGMEQEEDEFVLPEEEQDEEGDEGYGVGHVPFELTQREQLLARHIAALVVAEMYHLLRSTGVVAGTSLPQGWSDVRAGPRPTPPWRMRRCSHTRGPTRAPYPSPSLRVTTEIPPVLRGPSESPGAHMGSEVRGNGEMMASSTRAVTTGMEEDALDIPGQASAMLVHTTNVDLTDTAASASPMTTTSSTMTTSAATTSTVATLTMTTSVVTLSSSSTSVLPGLPGLPTLPPTTLATTVSATSFSESSRILPSSWDQ